MSGPEAGDSAPSAAYRGPSREDAERAYHQDAKTRAEAGFAPVSEDWTTALGNHVLTVRYRHDPEAAGETLLALDRLTTPLAQPALPDTAPEAPPPRAPAPNESSYMERFRGTEFETKSSQVPAPEEPEVSKIDAAITNSTLLIRVAALGLLLLGLLAVETRFLDVRIFGGPIEPVRPPARYPPYAAAYGFAIIGLASFIAGIISGLVPGRIARGPWKGMVIGFLGIALVGNIASLIQFDLQSEGAFALRGLLEFIAWAVLGATVVRLVLLPLFPPR